MYTTLRLPPLRAPPVTQTALQCHAAHDAACEHGRKYACGQTGPPYQEQHLPAWVHTRIHPTAKCGPFSCSAPRGSLRGETAACHGHVCSEPAAQALFVKSDHVTLSTRCIAKLAGSCAREGRGSDDNGLPHLLCAGGDRAQMTMGFPIFFGMGAAGAVFFGAPATAPLFGAPATATLF